MPAPRKVSAQQIDVLLGFMREHRAKLAKGQAVNSSQARQEVRSLWEELASRLNAQGTGVHKTAAEWRDYWRDTKYRVKKKAGAVEVDRRRTGGGPSTQAPLSVVEEGIYAIIDTRATTTTRTSRNPPFAASHAAARVAKISSAPGAASAVEIPQPQWAWEAEQRRSALDQRRLEIDERRLALDERREERETRQGEQLQEILQQILDRLPPSLPPP